MSYCRWSCDDFQSNVYCYEDEMGGYITHIAAYRIQIDRRQLPPKPSHNDPNFPAASLERWIKLRELLTTARRVPIGLPHDGESFNDPTLEALLERLLYLRELGYYVPEHAIERVRAEIKEESEASK